MDKKGIDIVDGVVRSLVKATDLPTFFTGLHNAFVHGEICPWVSQKDLATMFSHFEALNGVAEKYR